jgi:hypothetical protein
MSVDLRDVSRNNRLRIVTKDGEEFVGIVSGYEHTPADEYTKGSVRFPFEGDLWEQVKDRVDSEVLEVSQRFSRTVGEPKTATLSGHVEQDDIVDPFKNKTLGEIKTVEILTEATE